MPLHVSFYDWILPDDYDYPQDDFGPRDEDFIFVRVWTDLHLVGGTRYRVHAFAI